MLKFSDGTNIPEWFGDFGGNFCLNDTDFARLNYPAEEYEVLLGTEKFETLFRSILNQILPVKLKITKTESAGKIFYIAPALAKYYNIAGHLALAKLTGAKKIFVGTYDAQAAVCVAEAAREQNMDVRAVLGRKIADDQKVLKILEELNVETDIESTSFGFDLPYGVGEAPFGRDEEVYPVPVSANYGIYPKPGLTGILAGLYGEDLLQELRKCRITPECCVVPADTGLEAVGAYKALKYTEMALFTSENVVAQEYHACDTGTYTIVKKYADQKSELSTSLCPELVAMWRSGRVLRTGCDAILQPETEMYETAGFSAEGLRAVAMIPKQYKHILVLEKGV